MKYIRRPPLPLSSSQQVPTFFFIYTSFLLTEEVVSAMAIKATSVLAFLVILNVLVSFAIGRDIPKDSKNVDVKKPETFNQEGSVLIPGIGRFMIPPKKKFFFKGVNPFTYNPVTGTNTGHGISIPTLPNTGLPGYLPGNDDTFIPNPGFEVPTGFPAPPIRN